MSYYASAQDASRPLLVTSSMIGSFNSCRAKFAHRFIRKTPSDEGHTDPNWSGFGRAYHETLEVIGYDHRKFHILKMKEIVEKHGLNFDADGPKIAACIRAFFAGNLGNMQTMKPVGFEILFKTERNMGSVDAVFKDNAGHWWIIDNKTVGVPFDPAVKTKMISDIQVNMYAAHAKEIADVVNGKALALDFDAEPVLDPAAFAGFLYWEVRKPAQRHKEGETFKEFHDRIPDVAFRCTAVRANEFNPDVLREIRETTDAIHAFQIETMQGAEPTKNRRACVEFHSPCPYYSQCYGVTYAEAKEHAADVVNMAPALPLATDALDLF